MCENPGLGQFNETLKGALPGDTENFSKDTAVGRTGFDPAGSVGAHVAGSGVAGILGTIAGLGLAPFTGGASLAIPAGIGALSGVGGNLLGDLFAGSSVDPLSLAASGVGGAVTGGLGAELGGAGGSITGGDTAAAGADPFGAGSINPDLEGIASQGAQAGGGAAVSSAPALTGAADAGTGFASGQNMATLASFGDTAKDLSTAGGPGSVVPDTDAFPGTPAAGQLDLPGGVQQAASVADPSSAAGAAGASGGGFSLDNIEKWLGKNKNLLSAGGLLASLGKGALFPSAVPGSGTFGPNSQLAGQIANANAQGLNPAQQALSQQQIQGQIAAIKAKYAQLGLSGSTAEQQDIAHAQNANLAASSQAITQNAGTALNAIGVSNASTLPIAQQQLADDRQLSEAIALLAAMSVYGNQNPVINNQQGSQ